MFNDGYNMGGDGGWLWIIVVFALLFGWGNNGSMFGGRSGGVSDGYILTSDFSNIERKLDGVNNGICSLGYDQLAQMNGINQNVSNTGFAIQNAIQADTIANMQNTNALQSQLANCCCENREAISNLNYNLATQSCATKQAVADSTASILNAIKDMQTNALQDKIAELQAQNQALCFSASQQAQNNYLISRLQPTPIPSFPANQLYGYYGTTIA